MIGKGIGEYLLEKQCTKCLLFYPLSKENFYTQKSKDGFSPWCKTCRKNYQNNYHSENREAGNARKKAWYKKNRDSELKNFSKYFQDNKDERMRYLNTWYHQNKEKAAVYQEQHRVHKVTESEWEECKKYFNHRCAYCGLAIEEHYTRYRRIYKLTDLHKEHVYHDGKNDLSNCIPSCSSCNTIKRLKTINQFYNKEDNLNYSYERYHKIYIWIRFDYKKFIKKKRKTKIHIKGRLN